MPEVKKENTGWRDLALNSRHREWGWDVPATDIDFINFLEYDNKKTVALVEYKNENAPPIPKTNANIMALCDLGNKASIPVFVVRYARDFSWWTIHPANEFAKKIIPTKTDRITEQEYIKFLYRIRGRE